MFGQQSKNDEEFGSCDMSNNDDCHNEEHGGDLSNTDDQVGQNDNEEDDVVLATSDGNRDDDDEYIHLCFGGIWSAFRHVEDRIFHWMSSGWVHSHLNRYSIAAAESLVS